MKHLSWKMTSGIIAGALFLSACDSSGINSASESANDVSVENGSVIAGKYIVVLKKNQVAGKTAQDFVDDYATKEGIVSEQRYYGGILGFAGAISDKQLGILRSDPNVAYIEPDRVISLPPFEMEGGHDIIANPKPGNPGGGGGGGGTGAQTIPWGIARVNGGATYTGNNVAWILDTGIDLDHPDLNVDVTRSVSFLGGAQSTNPNDENGHGTHVSGTIAGINNTEGVVGVAAGATVISVRVLDRRGSGSYSGVIAGIEYVGANGDAGDVANMSLGGGFSQAVNDAVIAASAQVKFALAAGNESTLAETKSPASANGNNIYTICAIAEGDKWASYSNYGSPPVDFCEPGSSILSTWKDAGYNTISGTSMATPHAAGILLLGAIQNGGSVGGPDRSYTIGVH